MSELKYKEHNVSILLYHLVCPTKYRRNVISEEVDLKLREICTEISDRYEIDFLEIGTDGDHVHFLVQSVPMYSPTKIVRVIKSLTAKELFKRRPEIRKQLWGGEFWSDGYYIGTVGTSQSEEMMKQYVANQGQTEESIQPMLF